MHAGFKEFHTSHATYFQKHSLHKCANGHYNNNEKKHKRNIIFPDNVYTAMFPRSASLTARGPSLLCEAELLAAHLGLASLDPGAATTTALARVLGDKYGYRVD